MKVLIIAAHPDDEVLGCGGVVSKYRKKGDTLLTLFADLGRKDEIDQKFDTRPLLYWTQWIEEEVKRFKPDTVYTHWDQDLNLDHKIISEATQVACRPQSGVKSLYMYESLSSTEHSRLGFKPDTYIVLSAEEAEEKVKEMERLYPNELLPYPHARSREGILIGLKYRGLQIQREFAEGFITVRRIYG